MRENRDSGIDRSEMDHLRRYGARGERPADQREVDLYVRTYTTLLESSGAVSVSSFEPAHLTAAPSLHAGATEPQPDMNAMMYSLQRLPAKVMQIRHFVLGQSAIAFERADLNSGKGDGGRIRGRAREAARCQHGGRGSRGSLSDGMKVRW